MEWIGGYSMTKVEALKEYFDTFDLIDKYNKNNGYTSIEWLDTKGAYFSIVINPTQGTGRIGGDVLGNEIMQTSFMFNTMFPYNSQNYQAIANHSFFEDIIEWVNDNNRNKVFPILEDGEIPMSIEVQQTPYLFGVDPSNLHAQYSIIFQLKYRKLKRRK